MALHKDLAGANLHEPKGVSSASAGQVYVANGSGSGAWATPKVSYVALTRTIVDVSTAGDVYVVAPVGGTISKLLAVLEAAITVADANVTFHINGVSIDSSALVITESGSAAGDEFDSAPSGHNTVVAGDVIKITTDGASTTTAPLTVTVLINVT
jgi:hypothetical protein